MALGGKSLRGAIAVFFLLVAASKTSAAFRHGPVLLGEVPQGLEKPLAVADKAGLGKSAPSQQLVSAAQSVIASGKTVLLVGHTGTTGPKLLNRSLALEYAVNTAHGLARALKAETLRFACASAGESPERKEGWVELFAWTPPPEPPPPQKSAIVVLEPRPEEGEGSTVTLLRDAKVANLLFASEGKEGITLWRALTEEVLLTYKLPVRQSAFTYGGRYVEKDFAGRAEFGKPLESDSLALRTEEVENGWTRLSGKVPEGIRNVTVWAGPVPYPVTLDDGEFEVNVAQLPFALEVYAQGVDENGKKVAGPVLTLPPSPEEPPGVLAILVWENEHVDLDLHGWVREGHTQPLDSDPEVSTTAAEGVRLLFDGDGLRRASALTAGSAEKLEIEVSCFNDFGGGAKAMLYVYEYPGDNLKRGGIIIGPREISGEGARWIALRP